MVKTTIGQEPRGQSSFRPVSAQLPAIAQPLAQESLPSRADLNKIFAGAKASATLEYLAQLKPGTRATIDYPKNAKLGINVTEEGSIVLNYSNHFTAVTYLLIPTSNEGAASRFSPFRVISISGSESSEVPSVDALLGVLSRNSGTKLPVEFSAEVAFAPAIALTPPPKSRF